MAEDHVVEALGPQHLAAMLHQPLLFGAQPLAVVGIALLPALAAPEFGHGDGEVGMQPCEEPLAHGVAEHGLDQLVAVVARAQAIAVADQEALAVPLAHDGLAVHDPPRLRRHIVEDPHVVVADVEVHGDAAVGELGHLAQQPHMPARHGLPPLEPEVEQVPEQVDLRGILGRLIQEGADALLALQAARCIRDPEVEVAEEVDALAGLHALRRSCKSGSHGPWAG